MKPTNNSWTPPSGLPGYALFSIYHKTEADIAFAKELIEKHGLKILASGGTAKFLKKAGIEILDVPALTGWEDILSHRVVTLHPMVHGGLLGLKTEAHLKEMKEKNIPWISLAYTGLYPLEAEVIKEGATAESVTESTDIGGITIMRAAAKGARLSICDSADCIPLLKWLDDGAKDSDGVVRRLGAKAEFMAAKHCIAAANFHSNGEYAASFHANEHLNSKIFRVAA
jgi:phosphoribosylaminoimidazolecarboxamide formyltransferase/IMP cyclohydrolase